MTMHTLAGYCEHLSVCPGDTVNFMATGEGVSNADVQIVRLIHGDENPAGPGFIEREVDGGALGTVALTAQFTQVGSFIEVPDNQGRLLPPDSFTVHAFIWPTTPGKGRQGIVTQWSAPERRGYALGINDQGRLACWLGDGRDVAEVTAGAALEARCWYFVAASFDAVTRRVELIQQPVINAYNSLLSRVVPGLDTDHAAAMVSTAPVHCAAPLLLAGYHSWHPTLGRPMVAGLYNGKIDRSGLHARVLDRGELAALREGGEPPSAGLVARWDPTAGYTEYGIDDRLVDRGPHGLHGIGRNRPVRAMTGYNWRGRDDCFRLAPGQYGGIYFNDDAMIDCAWEPTFRWTVPDALPSGVYAARLRAQADGAQLEDHITFFVRPRAPQARIAMLMPTASYLAYANEHFVLDSPGVEAVTGHPLILHDIDYTLARHPEWGRSTYDHHSDGAGVCYSSYRRPVMALRPRHRMAATGVPWQFPADLSIIYWLDRAGFECDVITDEDLHREGVAILRPYNVVLNGTHSEYYSERMMDATEEYLAGGGRVMYLGANGYYWVIGFRDEEPWCMEVRKLDAGSRAWQAAPGEYYMATTGEKGGIWRNRGRTPQKLFGVGFTSEGMDESRPYRRLPDSYAPDVAWVFEGVEGEVFGEAGLALGGAAGIELDRYDLGLGTPPATWLLAASEGHSDLYPHVGEEILFNMPGLGGTQDFQVRADVTLFKTTNGGAVFSTGSIAWGQALPCNAGDNDVARITANVLRAFMQDGPLP